MLLIRSYFSIQHHLTSFQFEKPNEKVKPLDLIVNEYLMLRQEQDRKQTFVASFKNSDRARVTLERLFDLIEDTSPLPLAKTAPSQRLSAPLHATGIGAGQISSDGVLNSTGVRQRETEIDNDDDDDDEMDDSSVGWAPEVFVAAASHRHFVPPSLHHRPPRADHLTSSSSTCLIKVKKLQR